MINTSSILAKVKACMETQEKKALVNKKVNEYMTGAGTLITPQNISPTDIAAKEFIDVMKNRIASHAGHGEGMAASGGLGSTAVSAVSNISSSDVKIVSDGHEFEVGIGFDGDLSRPSLQPDRYGGVYNIATLLNEGYNANGYVSGEWHGNWIRSLKDRQGAEFIDEAKSEFMKTRANEFGVIDITKNYE